MRALVLLAIVTLAAAFPNPFKQCLASATAFKDSLFEALDKKDADQIIDEVEKVLQTAPSVLDTCGAQSEAEQLRSEYPPACLKLLAKETKLLVKIMRLYAEDQQKNEKAILLYSTMFESIYKTQVQKKCPTFSDQPMLEVKNKGDCAEGIYQLSLTFEKLDNDLMVGKFNASLTDVGKIVEKIPETLDSCNQHNIAKFIRYNFPEECLGALGGLVRQLATLEHNYSHLEWLRKHLKDFTSALVRVKDTCPALAH